MIGPWLLAFQHLASIFYVHNVHLWYAQAEQNTEQKAGQTRSSEVWTILILRVNLVIPVNLVNLVIPVNLVNLVILVILVTGEYGDSGDSGEYDDSGESGESGDSAIIVFDIFELYHFRKYGTCLVF